MNMIKFEQFKMNSIFIVIFNIQGGWITVNRPDQCEIKFSTNRKSYAHRK